LVVKDCQKRDLAVLVLLLQAAKMTSIAIIISGMARRVLFKLSLLCIIVPYKRRKCGFIVLFPGFRFL
jgi:hypothetical protein